MPLNNALQSTENILNKTGYIPGIGTVTSLVRATYGKIEAICGIAGAAFHSLKGAFTKNPTIKKREFAKAKESIKYTGHGLLNIGRAVLEFFPFLPLITCLPYDLNGHKFMVYKTTSQERP